MLGFKGQDQQTDTQVNHDRAVTHLRRTGDLFSGTEDVAAETLNVDLRLVYCRNDFKLLRR